MDSNPGRPVECTSIPLYYQQGMKYYRICSRILSILSCCRIVSVLNGFAMSQSQAF